jgi:hypothetical protein
MIDLKKQEFVKVSISPPDTCQICNFSGLDTEAFDSATRFGWGWICKNCYKKYGYGLGTGKGQQYRKLGNDWYKVAG